MRFGMDKIERYEVQDIKIGIFVENWQASSVYLYFWLQVVQYRNEQIKRLLKLVIRKNKQ